ADIEPCARWFQGSAHCPRHEVDTANCRPYCRHQGAFCPGHLPMKTSRFIVAAASSLAFAIAGVTFAAGPAAPTATTAPAADAACPALLRHTFNRLQGGQTESLCQFKGKVLLVVNTATYCGYTYQYEGLEALY